MSLPLVITAWYAVMAVAFLSPRKKRNPSKNMSLTSVMRFFFVNLGLIRMKTVVLYHDSVKVAFVYVDIKELYVASSPTCPNSFFWCLTTFVVQSFSVSLKLRLFLNPTTESILLPLFSLRYYLASSLSLVSLVLVTICTTVLRSIWHLNTFLFSTHHIWGVLRGNTRSPCGRMVDLLMLLSWKAHCDTWDHTSSCGQNEKSIKCRWVPHLQMQAVLGIRCHGA